MEDSKIIELLLSRNEDGIKRIDDTYGRRLFTLADNIVRNEAWDTIPPKKPMHLFAYLAKICRNFALKKLDWKAAAKRNAEVVSLTQEMETCIPDEKRDREIESRELGRILDAFLRTLSDENQMVFLRRYWFVDTIAEIAVRYGISESAVQMRLIRTKNKLAEYLAKEGIAV